MCFDLVLATGVFFNKVDQAESVDCSSTRAGVVLLCCGGSDPEIKSSGDGFQFPVAKRVVIYTVT